LEDQKKCPSTLSLATEVDGHYKSLQRLARAKQRSLKVASFRSSDLSEDPKKVDRHFWCGSFLVYRRSLSSGVYKLTHADFCKQRIVCPVCDLRRSAKLLSDWAPRLKTFVESSPRNLYLVTLTVKNGSDLVERFNHLIRSFQRLKKLSSRTSPWKMVDGYFGQYEVTMDRSGCYHPHLHLVCSFNSPLDFNGSFKSMRGFDFKSSWAYDLSEVWERITQDSFIVDVRPLVGDHLKACLEVLKYVAKPTKGTSEDGSPILLSPSELCLISRSLRGRHLMVSGGTLKRLSDVDSLLDEDFTEEEKWISIVYSFINGSYIEV
jgi:hypothetical protein